MTKGALSSCLAVERTFIENRKFARHTGFAPTQNHWVADALLAGRLSH
jgi:hypothetical protein